MMTSSCRLAFAKLSNLIVFTSGVFAWDVKDEFFEVFFKMDVASSSSANAPLLKATNAPIKHVKTMMVKALVNDDFIFEKIYI